MENKTNTCLIKLMDSLQRILSTGSGSLILTKQSSNDINIIDLFRELNDLKETQEKRVKFKDSASKQPNIPDYKITKREKEILSLILEEYTTHEIAEQLFISARTVDLHRGNLLQKLRAKNSLGLAKIAYKYNLI